jgi:quercetin dioxygenase-like cupin family protein
MIRPHGGRFVAANVRQLQPPTCLIGWALALLLAANAACAQTAVQAPLAGEAQSAERMVLSTGTTVTGEPIRYPTGTPAHVTAVEITLAPGQQTGWHMHPVPLFGYILEGELTVDYGAKGKRTYRKGDGLMEAMNGAHDGRNTGAEPVKILAVIIGAEGVQGSLPASPPAR